jgi:hypothetical protein
VNPDLLAIELDFHQEALFATTETRRPATAREGQLHVWSEGIPLSHRYRSVILQNGPLHPAGKSGTLWSAGRFVSRYRGIADIEQEARCNGWRDSFIIGFR